MSLLSKFRTGLKKTREGLGSKIGFLFRSRGDEREFYNDLEEILVSSDVGVECASRLVDGFRERCERDNIFKTDRMMDAFRSFLTEWMDIGNIVLDREHFAVLMLLGVNGSGKTTTTGKLAALFQKEGRRVMLAAADTYRAAAIEQLEVWSERVSVPMIKQKQGSDPGAVVFDGLSAAKARGYDLLIADTAGRFHNRDNLVRELQKISKIIDSKTDQTDRYIKLAVLDATAGGNAFEQARSFNDAVGLDGVILTKMDSSARGGVAIALAGLLKLPIWMIGVGESLDDLIPFDVESYVSALLES